MTAASVSDSHDQPSKFPQRRPSAEARRLGHDLKQALASAWGVTERLTMHVIARAPVGRDLADLRRALAEAEHIADALLEEASGGRRPQRRDSDS